MKKKTLRIALVGNIANNFYREAKALQGIENLTVHLYAQINLSTPNTELPESDEPLLKNNYPAWINIFRKIFIKDLIFESFFLGFLSKKRNKYLIDSLNKYDICIFSGPEIILIPQIKTRTIFRATGSDLTVFPIFSYEEFTKLRDKKSNNSNLIYSKIIYNIKKNLYKKSIKNATLISSGIGSPYEIALEKLRVKPEKCLQLFRLAIDTEVFEKKPNAYKICELNWSIKKEYFIIFIPSRMMIKDSPVHRATGQWKASDKAIHAFNIFLSNLSEELRKSVKLVIPERTRSDDLTMAKILIKNLELNDSVLFVSGEAQDGLTRQELINLYSRSNVVLDDFGAGWYGSVVVEALSCECPVITYVPNCLMESIFPWHPLLLAKEIPEIVGHLMYLYNHGHQRKNLGYRCRGWVKEFHSNEAYRIMWKRNIDLLHERLIKNS